MKINILTTMAAISCATAVILTWFYIEGPPSTTDLVSHTGEITARRVTRIGTNGNKRLIKLAVTGFDPWLTHAEDMPGFQALAASVRRGQTVRVLYDRRDHWRHRTIFGLVCDGETVVATEPMLEWSADNRWWFLLVAIFMLLAGGFLGWLGLAGPPALRDAT